MSLLAFLLLVPGVLSQCESIDYTKGGANWAGTCATGSMQSPIDLIEGVNMTSFPHYLFLHYPLLKVIQTNNCAAQYTLMLTPLGEMIAKDNSTNSLAYHTAEVFWHSPSEHLIAGVQQDLEMQIRHSLYGGTTPFTTAVLSILFVSDTDPSPNPFFQQMIDSETGDLLDVVSGFSLSGVISKTTTFSPYFYYQGSMTIPPCSEGVGWYVLATPERISKAQLQAFTSKWSQNKTFADGNGNNRVVQPLGSRTLYVNSGNTRSKASHRP